MVNLIHLNKCVLALINSFQNTFAMKMLTLLTSIFIKNLAKNVKHSGKKDILLLHYRCSNRKTHLWLIYGIKRLIWWYNYRSRFLQSNTWKGWYNSLLNGSHNHLRQSIWLTWLHFSTIFFSLLVQLKDSLSSFLEYLKCVWKILLQDQFLILLFPTSNCC